MTKPYRLFIFLAFFLSFACASAAVPPSPTPVRQISPTATTAASQSTTAVEQSPASTGDKRAAQVVWLFCGLLLILSILVIVFLFARQKPASREP